MGHYTEFFFAGEFRVIPSTQQAAEAIRWLYGRWSSFELEPTLPDHPFFRCDRAASLPSRGSAYFPGGASSLVFMDRMNPSVCSFTALGSLKNYDDEIEKFFDWLSTIPGIDWHGYWRDESTPTVYVKYYQGRREPLLTQWVDVSLPSIHVSPELAARIEKYGRLPEELISVALDLLNEECG